MSNDYTELDAQIDRLTARLQDFEMRLKEMEMKWEGIFPSPGVVLGSMKSPAKTAAARENGKLGGRPRKA